MVVRRIVANIASDAVADVRKFYVDLFGLDVAMDFGWVATLAGAATSQVQISIASEGGSGTPLPDLSIEVDDVDAVYARARELDVAIDYELTDEPWGVRRFYVLDPTGKRLNILSHSE